MSPRAINRAVLARQLLLERASLSPERAVEQVAGIQAQYAPSMYVGLWSRLRDFGRDDMTLALSERRVVQGTLMRATIHAVSAQDYPLLCAGIRSERQAWWLRTTRSTADAAEMDALADVVRRVLAQGPVRAADLAAHLEAEGFDKPARDAAGLWVDLLRVPPSGTWERRRADLYSLADRELPGVGASERDGLAVLVQRYLSGFGPARLADVANWAGVRVTPLRLVAEEMDLRRFRDEDGKELLDLPDAPLPDPDTPAPVRFLPTWDATLLVHARRARILPEEYRPRIFSNSNPQSLGTFLVDGAVAGTWRLDQDEVTVTPFEPLAASALDEVEEESRRLASFCS